MDPIVVPRTPAPSDVYFPRVNGVSTSIQTFRHELASLGHTVDLIAPAYLHACAEDSHTLCVPSCYLPFDPEDGMMKPGAVRALLPQLRDTGYDLVHIQTPFVAHYLGTQTCRHLAGRDRIEQSRDGCRHPPCTSLGAPAVPVFTPAVPASR